MKRRYEANIHRSAHAISPYMISTLWPVGIFSISVLVWYIGGVQFVRYRCFFFWGISGMQKTRMKAKLKVHYDKAGGTDAMSLRHTKVGYGSPPPSLFFLLLRPTTRWRGKAAFLALRALTAKSARHPSGVRH